MEMHAAIHAIAPFGVSPIVRLPSGESWLIKRALDAGAHGIVIPMVSTAVSLLPVRGPSCNHSELQVTVITQYVGRSSSHRGSSALPASRATRLWVHIFARRLRVVV